MVTVIDYTQRTNKEGEPFNALIVQGDIEIATSKDTGKPYATARRASIPSTFDENTCQSMVGKELPGEIERVPSQPYEYNIPDSDETVILEYTFEYNPEPSNVEEEVFEPQKNGKQMDSLV